MNSLAKEAMAIGQESQRSGTPHDLGQLIDQNESLSAGGSAAAAVAAGSNGNVHNIQWYFNHYRQYNSGSAAAAAAAAAGTALLEVCAERTLRHDQ